MLAQKQLATLQKLLPKKVSTLSEDLHKHGGELFYLSNYLPDAVCYPSSNEDVIAVTTFCLKHKIPLIPYGSGTSVEGHTAPVNGGITLDMSHMAEVIEFAPEDGLITVQAGMPYNKLNSFLDLYGFHFPVEAGWGASIGGMVATNASGAGAVDAGSMAKNVVHCSVVVFDANGVVQIQVGSKAPKTSAGYNLLGLFVGSEGTLGIITEVTLKIRKNFAFHKTICCQFYDIRQAISTAIALKDVVQLRRFEFLDKLQTNACISYSNIDYLRKDYHTVLIELAGSKAQVESESDQVQNCIRLNKAINSKCFNDVKGAEEIWSMRKQAAIAAIHFIGKNKKAIVTDVSLPLSKLADCMEASYRYMDDCGIKAPVIAHIGDGNFHFTMVVDPSNEKEIQMAKQFNKLVVTQALKMGGTCTAEHGIGLGKKHFLQAEHGDSIFLMKAIKQAFDPYGIFNPGKVLSSSFED